MGGVSCGHELLSGRHSLITSAKREFNGGATTFTGENENFTGERVMNDQNTYRKRPPSHTKEPHHDFNMMRLFLNICLKNHICD
ncbi:hypothetical protein IHV09_09125 [Fictibacillus sp. 23RED33]|uniref:hypothetical protein n=1 Tax=Fictibacillus sp. 23RED33 TaxID=2745879 RepID=UPI0018CE56A0|nr:hypothetical protein [Fictibacillus sp. 23RED33]MBH0173719.1 hypothetical protein [Fictibacillus sp. 23RED33]